MLAPTGLQVGALTGGRLVLQWQDQATDEAGFQVERAHGITGTAWSLLATLPPNTTQYTDTPGLLGESFWYRVRAYNAQGNSAYTSDSFNSTIATVPSANELYLMALINEARADPARQGYPAYPPVPPLAYHPLLAASAHAHSQSILNSVFQFGHCDPIGRCPGDRARASGYLAPSGCTENLTTGNTGPQQMRNAHQAFLRSPGHRDSMLDPNAKEFAVGHTYDVGKGESSRHGQVTEVFCGQPNFTPPTLAGGAVAPYTGTLTTPFGYLVTFYAPDNSIPTTAHVIIDGVVHDLTLTTGQALHGTYRYTTTLTASDAHSYYFQFTYGGGQTTRWPPTGAIDQPDVWIAQGVPNTPTPVPSITPAATVTPTPTTPATPVATPLGTDHHEVYLPLVRR